MDTNKESEDILYTVTEVAAAFKVKPGTIYSKVARRELPFVKIGNLVRFRREDIDLYLGAHLVGAIR